LPGVGFFYKKTGFPIVAAKIYGTEKVLPKEAKFIKLGKIKVIFDRVQNINEEDDYREITFKVLEKIKNL
jgi:1-acyl-sn-glycerol-3-phosphate acyltransferase